MYYIEQKTRKRNLQQKEETTLTPTGRCATKYFSGVFVVGIQHEPLGQWQFAFVRVKADERRFAAVIHFRIVDEQTKMPKKKSLITILDEKNAYQRIVVTTTASRRNGKAKLNTK